MNMCEVFALKVKEGKTKFMEEEKNNKNARDKIY